MDGYEILAEIERLNNEIDNIQNHVVELKKEYDASTSNYGNMTLVEMIEHIKGDRSIRRMALDSGISASYITGMLKHGMIPSVEMLCKMTKYGNATGITVHDLVDAIYREV